MYSDIFFFFFGFALYGVFFGSLLAFYWYMLLTGYIVLTLVTGFDSVYFHSVHAWFRKENGTWKQTEVVCRMGFCFFVTISSMNFQFLYFDLICVRFDDSLSAFLADYLFCGFARVT